MRGKVIAAPKVLSDQSTIMFVQRYASLIVHTDGDVLRAKQIDRCG